MAMFITQDTFDEVVKENIEDFGMDRKSAAEDAVGQFKAQGGAVFPLPLETSRLLQRSFASLKTVWPPFVP